MPDNVSDTVFSRLVKNKPLYILILIFIIITSIKVILSGMILSPHVFTDEYHYDLIAQQIYTGALFASSIPYPSTSFPPAYPFLISFAYLLSPDKYVVYHFMLAMNAAITSSILFPAYYLLKPLTTHRISLVTALLITLMPTVTIYSFVLMSEAFFIPLFLFSVLFIHRSLNTSGPCIWDILTGFSIFTLFFIRTAGFSMIVGLLFAFGWFCLKSKETDLQVILKKGIWIGLPAFILYLAWIVDQTAMKGGMPSGYEIAGITSQCIETLAKDPFHILYVILLHVDYLVLASFIILPFFLLLSIVYIYQKKILLVENNTFYIGRLSEYQRYIPAFIYSIISSLLVFLIGVAFMSMPTFNHAISTDYSLSGRYVDPVLPIIIILGVIGMYYLSNHNSFRKILIYGLVYVGVISFLTSWVMIPVPHEPNNISGIYYLYSFSSDYIIPQLVFVIGIFLLVFSSIIIHKKKEIVSFLLILIIIALLSIVPVFYWEIETSEKTGSLLPFCQQIHTLCDDSGQAYWDTTSDNTDWDKIVYYTLKFWLVGRVVPLDEKGKKQDTGIQWIISKNTMENSTFTYGEYRVSPLRT
jgi:hypothetical protein